MNIYSIDIMHTEVHKQTSTETRSVEAAVSHRNNSQKLLYKQPNADTTHHTQRYTHTHTCL